MHLGWQGAFHFCLFENQSPANILDEEFTRDPEHLRYLPGAHRSKISAKSAFNWTCLSQRWPHWSCWLDGFKVSDYETFPMKCVGRLHTESLENVFGIGSYSIYQPSILSHKPFIATAGDTRCLQKPCRAWQGRGLLHVSRCTCRHKILLRSWSL